MLLRKMCVAADFFVAQNSDTLGYCAVYANNVQKLEAYITMIAVKEEYQRKHIGQVLLDTVTDFCIYINGIYRT